MSQSQPVPANDAAGPALELEPEVLTIPELAHLLRMNVNSVYEIVARGDIPGTTKVGRSWRAHRATVVAWLAGQISAPKRKRGVR
jgi:excisionase family DNA binding protein